MVLTDKEEEIKLKAISFAKANKVAIAKELTDKTIFTPEADPVSVFMAGSPGAGKTEASKSLLESLSENHSMVLRIDPDELRCRFEDYSGDNSWLFQGAISLLVEKIHDLALKQKQSFLLDGTLSKYEIASISASEKFGPFLNINMIWKNSIKTTDRKRTILWRFCKQRNNNT